MYFKLNCNLDFHAIGAKLAPDASPYLFDHDSENVYEWMYIKIQGLAFLLNISREHGWADIDDELLDFDSTATNDELQALVKPGPVYIFGWDLDANYYVNPLPEWLPQHIADKLNVDVLVFDRRINVELPDGVPIALVKPTPTIANNKTKRQGGRGALPLQKSLLCVEHSHKLTGLRRGMGF